MADTIKCPVCGEINPADIEFCQNCQSRLQPLTGPLKGEDAPLTPGQAPTKKTTSELEPILPQWLRDARQQARRTAEEDALKEAEAQKTTPVSKVPDLLAGLTSQHETEDEETPDWLANITGVPAHKKKTEPEDAQVKFVELGHEEEPAVSASQQATPAESEQGSATPWMGGQESKSEKDELAEWFAQASASMSDESAASVQPASSQPEPSAILDEGIADWLKNLDANAPALEQNPVEPEPASSAELPDWLKNLEAGKSFIGEPPAQPVSSSNVESPDWLKNLDAGHEPPVQQSPAQKISGAEPADHETAEIKSEIPEWLQNLGQEGETTKASSDEVLPDWLKSAGPSAEEPPAEKALSAVELPDWASSPKPVEPRPFESNQAAPLFTPEEKASMPENLSAPAFTPDSLSSSDADDIFGAAQLPDWLSQATSQPSAEENLPPAEAGEGIAPAELPSWVEAMRPVEAAMPAASATGEEAAVESSGPLAGLQGVLPVIPGVIVPSSKPKSHSIKINATDEHQSQAMLLEKILAAETAPIPMKAGSVITSQRILRWALSAVLLIVLGAVVFGHTQIFPLPGAVPNETFNAVQAVNAIPGGAPVLAVFDYQPSTVGEMEASGSPLMYQLILLKHPRLALVSTSPTGAALAERFMSTTLSTLNAQSYQRGQQYVDLGYLPGGLSGIYAFAQNPITAMPLDVDRSAAWQSPPLQSVTRLSDFAAVIVLTDSVDAGRAWIEQTALARGTAPIILVSSAQAAPMFMPYVDSGQAAGLISGLNGAAGAEQANGGRPGFIRRYWDAYSVGLLIAVLLIAVGSLWNLVIGIQARRERGTK